MTFTCPYCKTSFPFAPEYICNKLECSECGKYFQLSICSTPAPTQIFLDIETTGFSSSYAQLTTVVWYGDGAWGHWVNNGMSIDALTTAWNNSNELVTFNGLNFDEPWLIEKFNFLPHKNHVDLLNEAGAQGITGGLKKISERLGIPRPAELNEMEGKDAPKLWKSYDKGNKCSLCNLLYYNAWDVVLTYNLYCRLNNISPAPIQDTIPFSNNQNALKSVIESGSNYRTPYNRTYSPQITETPNTKTYSPQKTETPKTKSRPKHYIAKKDLLVLWETRLKSPLTTLKGAFICFTLDMQRYEREDAEKLATSLGAIVVGAVQRLDFLIVGDTRGWGETGKITKVKNSISKGAHTQIIDEKRFLELVQATKDSE